LTGDADVVLRVAAYYTGFAREQRQQGVPGYVRLDAERAHLLRVLDTCKAQAQWPAISALVGAVSQYLNRCGYWTDYQAALEINLFAAQQQGDRQDEGWCLGSLGYLALKRGDYATALTYLEQSLVIRRAIGDKAGEGATLNNLATTAYAGGDYATALTYLEQSLAIRREIGDKAGEGATLNNLSQIYDARGDYATALTYLEQSLAIQRAIGDKAGEGTTLTNIGAIYYKTGHQEQAKPYFLDALTIFEALHSPNAAVVRGWLENYREKR
jgi:tetratricopeptide (TPR) repeat protein